MSNYLSHSNVICQITFDVYGAKLNNQLGCCVREITALHYLSPRFAKLTTFNETERVSRHDIHFKKFYGPYTNSKLGHEKIVLKMSAPDKMKI